MFDHEIPTAIEGFELAGGEEEAKTMKRIWPVGDGVTESIMRRFTETKMRNAKFFDPPLEGDEEKVDDPKRKSKIGLYQEGRNRVDWDGTSHISYVCFTFPRRAQSPPEIRAPLPCVSRNQLTLSRLLSLLSVPISQRA